VEEWRAGPKKEMTDCVSLLPPGTIYASFTEEDTLFCGGHFLIAQVMDRFVDVLCQTELDPSKTSDLEGVNIFNILENFIIEALDSSSAGLTRAQLHRFVLVLKKYAALRFDPHGESGDDRESKHMKRRREFLDKLRKRGWISKLNDNVSNMSW
jgi:hypothetical protein